ncbi:MAG: hypothetical protein ACE5HI_17050 [bacterium]
MTAKIALITIFTNNEPVLLKFYRDVLGFGVKMEMGEYVEFECEGVGFAICDRSIMVKATGRASYKETKKGQSFELAFPLATPEEVD